MKKRRQVRDLLRPVGRACARAVRFLRDTHAVSTVEYALIVVAVIAIIGVAAGTLSGAFKDLFGKLETEIGVGINTVKESAKTGGTTPTTPKQTTG